MKPRFKFQKRAIPSKQDRPILPTQVANQNTEFASTSAHGASHIINNCTDKVAVDTSLQNKGVQQVLTLGHTPNANMAVQQLFVWTGSQEKKSN